MGHGCGTRVWDMHARAETEDGQNLGGGGTTTKEGFFSFGLCRTNARCPLGWALPERDRKGSRRGSAGGWGGSLDRCHDWAQTWNISA